MNRRTFIGSIGAAVAVVAIPCSAAPLKWIAHRAFEWTIVRGERGDQAAITHMHLRSDGWLFANHGLGMDNNFNFARVFNEALVKPARGTGKKNSIQQFHDVFAQEMQKHNGREVSVQNLE